MIADAIKQAQALARKAQEATYDGRCTVMEHQKLKDPKTRITTEKDVVVLEMNHAAYHIPVLVQWIRRNQQQRRHRSQSCFYLRTCRSSREQRLQ